MSQTIKKEKERTQSTDISMPTETKGFTINAAQYQGELWTYLITNFLPKVMFPWDQATNPYRQQPKPLTAILKDVPVKKPLDNKSDIYAKPSEKTNI